MILEKQVLSPIAKQKIDLNLDRIGKKALYLGADLPFNIRLSYIDLSKDINFIEKCLLSTVTNSILFNLATKCIDNLNFNINTTKSKSKTKSNQKWFN